MSMRTALMEMANNQMDEARKPSPGKDDGFATPDPRATKTVDYGKRMTDAQKKNFHALKKKMTDGPEHQKIMRKNQSRIKSDDEFHNLVLKKAMSEEVELDEAKEVLSRFSSDRLKQNIINLAQQKGLKVKEMGDKIEVSGVAKKVMDLTLAVQKSDVKVEQVEERAAWVPESIADEQVEAFMEATLAAVTEGADTFVFEGKHYKAKSKAEAKKLDPVGKADADIDNDGDVDSSDDYLKNRRKAIKKSMKDDEVNEIDGAASGMRAADKEPTVNLKALKKRRAAEKARKTARPSPLRGKKDMKFESTESVEEAKADEGNGLWANIHKKRKEGRPMRKPGSKGAPTKQDFKNARGEQVEEAATAQTGKDDATTDTFQKQMGGGRSPNEKTFVDLHKMEVGLDAEKINDQNKASIESALKQSPARMGDNLKNGDTSFVSPLKADVIDGITKALQQMKTNN